MKKPQQWLLFFVKGLLTAACLWWALSGVDFGSSIFARPGDLDWRWIFSGLAFAGAAILLTAARWWLLLRAQDVCTGFWRTVELTLIGNLFNLAAVGGIGGGAARVFLLIREHPDRKLAITLTVMVDHLVGLVSMALLFFAVTAGRFDALEEQSALGRGVIRFAWVFFAGGLGLIALMFVMSYPPVHQFIHRPGRGWKWEVLRRLPELNDIFRRRWPHALGSLAVSTAMLPVYFATFWCGARAAGGDVGFGPVFSAMPVVDAISAMPISIAGIGVREKTFELLMNDLTGMPDDIAVSGSLIGFFCSLIWSLLGALLFLKPRDRVRIGELENAGR